MMVIMNGKGLYARVSESNGHTGLKQRIDWGGLNDATLFNNKISRRDYEKIYDELMLGIFIQATVTRVVTLHKHPVEKTV